MSLGGGSRPFRVRVLSAPMRAGGFAGDKDAPPQPRRSIPATRTARWTNRITPTMWIPKPPAATRTAASARRVASCGDCADLGVSASIFGALRPSCPTYGEVRPATASSPRPDNPLTRHGPIS